MLDVFATNDVVLAVGATLVNFLWQAVAIGLVTAAVLAACPRATAATRYIIACVGLAAMAAAPALTFALVWRASGTTATADVVGAAYTAASVLASAAAVAGADSWVPSLVSAWALVVAGLTLRLAHGWWTTESVRHRDTHAAPEWLAQMVHQVATRLHIRRPIAVVESPWIDVPAVIGWLRPTILLPIGALTGLSAQQLEALLSHELAHVRRHDYLVNALQHVVETLFFFHPSVWWLSGQIRVEREHCCDDVAVRTTGSAVEYARALATLEESRLEMPLALAASDGSLLARIRRIVGPAGRDNRVPSFPIAACVVVIMGVVVFANAQTRAAGPETRRISEVVTLSGSRFPTAPKSTAPSARPETATASAQRGTPPPPPPAPTPGTESPRGDAPPPPPPPPPTPLRVGGGIREPRKIVNVPPVYPEAARTAGIEGVVILEAKIETDGSVSGLRVLRSIPDLDQAAINAVRQWVYQPTLLNGQPVAVTMTVTVNFSLVARTQTTFARESGVFERAPSDEAGGAMRVPAAASGTNVEPPPSGYPLRLGGDISEPKRVRHVSPVYPADARSANVSGVVILEATLDQAGNVTNARVLRSIPMLDEAAVQAVQQWRYTPAILHGVAVPVIMTVTVNFVGD